MKKKHSALFFAFQAVLICSLFHILGKCFPEDSFLYRCLDTLKFGALLVAIFIFFLNYTKEGRRVKKDIIDPIIKPDGEELRYWNEDGSPIHQNAGHDAEHAWKEKKKRGLRLSPQALGNGRTILAICIALFLLYYGLGLFLTWEKEPLTLYSADSAAAKNLLDGIFHADTSSISKGFFGLLHTLGRDIKTLLTFLLIGLVLILITQVVKRLSVHRKKNRYEEYKDGDEI